MRDPEITSRIMRAVRREDTGVEVAFRRALYARGVRYRKNLKAVKGTPDVVIRRAKLAVFIDGDFWHGNSWRLRGLPNMEAMFPNRTDYWISKIHRNMDRDQRTNVQLRRAGWTVMRFWESEILEDVNKCVDTVVAYLSQSS